jgi:cytidylate kinase
VNKIVAIDGPSGAGKSTVARAVAEALAVPTLDTGAMYRAVTLAALEREVPIDDAEACGALARSVHLSVDGAVLLDGRDVTAAIRGPDVTAAVSIVSAHPFVRTALVAHQRAWADQHDGGVVEGRDIGTVVFPDAAVKVFLTASDEVRARRRQHDEAAADRAIDLEQVRRDLERRDRLDATRAQSPLVAAPDALHIDTTSLDVGDIVTRIVDRYHAVTGAAGTGDS